MYNSPYEHKHRKTNFFKKQIFSAFSSSKHHFELIFLIFWQKIFKNRKSQFFKHVEDVQIPKSDWNFIIFCLNVILFLMKPSDQFKIEDFLCVKIHPHSSIFHFPISKEKCRKSSSVEELIGVEGIGKIYICRACVLRIFICFENLKKKTSKCEKILSMK